MLDGKDRQRSLAGRPPGRVQGEARQHGLGDRQRHGVAAGGAQDRRGVGEAGEAARRILGNQRIEEAGFLDRVPQRLGPDTRLGRIDKRRWREVAEKPHRRVMDSVSLI